MGTTKAGGMHPTGMLSCLSLFQDFTIQLRTAVLFSTTSDDEAR